MPLAVAKFVLRVHFGLCTIYAPSFKHTELHSEMLTRTKVYVD